jgi:hypothetical protein
VIIFAVVFVRLIPITVVLAPAFDCHSTGVIVPPVAAVVVEFE